MAVIEKLRENMFQMQICTDIPPGRKAEINHWLRILGLDESGTTNGWTLDESVEAVECAEGDNRWHYICTC